MYSYLDFKIPEPYRNGNNVSLTWNDFVKIRANVSISKKFNDYLRGKSVVVVGPSPYLKGLGRGDFIDSFDVVVRLNKGWRPAEELTQDYGKKTNIRWHCMMEHPNNGGPYDVDSMIEYGVEWLASAFPRNLDYFHYDNIKFEETNKDRIQFHIPCDLIYYMNIHTSLETRPNVAPTAIFDLVNYDIKKLHLTGVSFFRDGWVGDYKKGATNTDTKGKYSGMKDMQKEGHAQEAQMNLIKVLEENLDFFTVDEEIKFLINEG